MNEVENLKRFQGSKNVVGFRELHEGENSVYLVMPYYAGGVLQVDRKVNKRGYSEKDI